MGNQSRLGFMVEAALPEDLGEKTTELIHVGSIHRDPFRVSLAGVRGLIAAEIRRKREDRPAIRILLARILHARPRFPVTDLPGGALEVSLAVASGAFDLAGPRNLVAVHRLRITAFPVLGACAGCIRRSLWDAAEGKHRKDEKDNRKGNDSGAQEEMLHGNSGERRLSLYVQYA